MLNSKISYSYSDASNCKAHNECVINGLLSEAQRQIILNCLYEGEFFVPGAVGLDVELPWEYNPQDDHPYWTIDADSFDEVSQCPTVNISAEELVSAFVENRDKWEQLGAEYVMQFEDDFEPASVLDVIQEASERSENQVDGGYVQETVMGKE